MLYIFIIILLFVLCYHYDYQGHKVHRIEWYLFIWLIFVFVAGLRYRIGVDTVRYMMGFDELPDLMEYKDFDFESTRYGRAYLLLNAIVKTLFSNFVAIQFVLAIIVNGVIFNFIYKNTKHIFLAILFYFIFQYFNYNFEILRESCAISIFLISWPYFVKKKWWSYYICCAIAILFHPSALITLFVPLLRLRILGFITSFSIWTIPVLIGVYVFGMILSKMFFEWIRLIEVSQLDNYANTYEFSDYSEGRSFNIIGIGVNLVKVIIYPVGAILLLKRNYSSKDDEVSNSEYFSALEIMYFCLLVFMIASIPLRLLYRFSNYFYPFLFIVLANTNFEKIRFRKNIYKLSFGIWMVILFPYLSINIYGNFEEMYNISKFHRYYPYENIIFPKKDRVREQLYNNEGLDRY